MAKAKRKKVVSRLEVIEVFRGGIEAVTDFQQLLMLARDALNIAAAAEAEHLAALSREAASKEEIKRLEKEIDGLEDELIALPGKVVALADKVLGHEDALIESLPLYELRRALDDLR